MITAQKLSILEILILYELSQIRPIFWEIFLHLGQNDWGCFGMDYKGRGSQILSALLVARPLSKYRKDHDKTGSSYFKSRP